MCHSVKFLFTLSGGHISPILCASEKQGIRIIDTRHEVNAVFAADAVARLSGKSKLFIYFRLTILSEFKFRFASKVTLTLNKELLEWLP